MDDEFQEYISKTIKIAKEFGITKEEFNDMLTPPPTTEEMQKAIKTILITLTGVNQAQ